VACGQQPSFPPSLAPSRRPTHAPTALPTASTSTAPTQTPHPTLSPTRTPTSVSVSVSPVRPPTTQPTLSPTQTPTVNAASGDIDTSSKGSESANSDDSTQKYILGATVATVLLLTLGGLAWWFRGAELPLIRDIVKNVEQTKHFGKAGRFQNLESGAAPSEQQLIEEVGVWDAERAAGVLPSPPSPTPAAPLPSAPPSRMPSTPAPPSAPATTDFPPTPAESPQSKREAASQPSPSAGESAEKSEITSAPATPIDVPHVHVATHFYPATSGPRVTVISNQAVDPTRTPPSDASTLSTPCHKSVRKGGARQDSGALYLDTAKVLTP
jgi:hypothetical protein